jgi:hypothetical protein
MRAIVNGRNLQFLKQALLRPVCIGQILSLAGIRGGSVRFWGDKNLYMLWDEKSLYFDHVD